MTSDRKIKANRTNARVSTGPKTRHGRARSAKNAFRHGLSLPVQSDQGLSEEVQALARHIAGPCASVHIQILAHRVAEAQVDLHRVRQMRHQFLSDRLSNPYCDFSSKRKDEVGSHAQPFATTRAPNSDGSPGEVGDLNTARLTQVRNDFVARG